MKRRTMNTAAVESAKFPMASDVRAKTIAKTVTNQLRADILNGRLLPGLKLHLDDLKQSLGVSLSPLREGLSRLAAEGLVTGEDQRGFSVAPVSKQDFLEIIDLRTMLEIKALRTSIEQGGDEWEARVVTTHHLLSKVEDRRWKESHFTEWEDKHRTFHDALIRASNSPLLLSFSQILVDMNHRYRRLYNLKSPPKRDVAQEHQDLAEAALARNADKACTLLKEHIDRTAKNILKSMDS